MNLKYLSTIICLTIIFSSCQKQPTAAFTKDSESYIAGDTIHLTSRSENAATYKWTLPDGKISTNKNIDYATTLDFKGGKLLFQLEAFSKNGQKTDKTTKSIFVDAAYGELMIWKSNTTPNDVTVIVDNNFTYTLTQSNSISVVPECGDITTLTLKTFIGSHTINATDGIITWNDTINITRDSCYKLLLQ